MDLIFEMADEIVIVRIKGRDITFSTSTTNFQTFVPIENLRLSVEGITKEFPDLRGLEVGEMRKQALERFKVHIKTLGTESEIENYVIKELESSGYMLKSRKRDGFREVKVK